MVIAVVVAYFAFLVVVGLLARRRVKGSTDEFFVAGRSLGTFANSWAFLASLASGGSVLATVGTALALGFPYGACLLAGAPVGFTVASILVARPLRRLGRYTVPDFFRWRYRSRLISWLLPILIVVASSAYIVAQMKGASLVASSVLGIDYKWGLWGAGIVFILYVSIGGFLSVTWNDIFQGILMFSAIVGFSIAVLSAMDGYGASYEAMHDGFPQLGEFAALPMASYIGGFLTWAVAISVLPHVIMRVYSARSARSARVSLNNAMLIYAVMMLLSALVLVPGAAALLEDIDLSNPDALFFALSEAVLNPLMQGVVAAAVLAAIMSTTAGLLMACNSAIAHDLYGTLIRPQASEREVLRVASIATWVVGLGCTAIAMNPPEMLIVLYTAAVGLLAASCFAPMVLGIWWSRTTTAGAAAGMLGGALAFGIAFVGFDMPTSSEILVGLPLSFVLTIGVSLTTREVEGAREEEPAVAA
ncbi:sodium/pantothenate symporter [Mumia flava]|uniref:Sodium/pantothenate symporter n=1 Tax=Mumia flava TaxID=1348852 RepID=A0A0B2BJK2_9ACTN|nr:sodium:solute symporter family protein [Mumia flava]PJJ57421.1 sodium/pantothenate symporter [Mumia flava]